MLPRYIDMVIYVITWRYIVIWYKEKHYQYIVFSNYKYWSRLLVIYKHNWSGKIHGYVNIFCVCVLSLARQHKENFILWHMFISWHKPPWHMTRNFYVTTALVGIYSNRCRLWLWEVIITIVSISFIPTTNVTYVMYVTLPAL